MHLRKGFWIGLACCAALVSCKGGDKDSSEGEAANADRRSELAASEDALLGKRDALLNMRQSISQKRADLETKRSEVIEAGGDTTELDQKAKDLAAEDKRAMRDLFKVSKQVFDQGKDMLNEARAGGGPAVKIASREAGIASREKQIARRENEVAARESALSKREEGLASKWKDSCAVGAPTTIIRTVDTKGSSYTKKDVEPLLKKARREMGKKGLLRSDLPEQAKGLEKEANQGMKDGDYGRARLAASQLYGTVRATKINKAFIAAKIARLNQRIGGKRLSSKSEVLFRQATSAYGDAKFSSANGKLNKIYSLLR